MALEKSVEVRPYGPNISPGTPGLVAVHVPDIGVVGVLLLLGSVSAHFPSVLIGDCL